MERRQFNCPFTGGQFEANVFDWEMIVYNQLTNTMQHYPYDAEHDCYLVPRKLFADYDIIQAREIAEILGVSHQRVYTLMDKGTLPVVTIGDTRYCKRVDVLEYAANRKIGRPRKADGNGTDD